MKRAGVQQAFGILLILVLVQFRAVGLFRGLANRYYFHPDESKQMMALDYYLQGLGVWYTGNPFVDGYPFGLNVVDSLVLRPLFALRAATGAWLNPGTDPVGPDRHELFYWARALRVAYSVLTALLAYAAACRVLASRGAALFAFAGLVIAPLAITTAHSATGDLGAEMFTVLMLYLLSRHVESPRWGWLAGAGLAVGAAFACKFNGLLAGFGLVCYLALAPAPAPRRWGRRLAQCATAAAGGLAGALLLTPAFFADVPQAWRNMQANFVFIRNYDVAPAFLARPAWEQGALSLAHQVGPVTSHLGWFVCGLAVWGAFAAAHQLRSVAGPQAPRATAHRVLLFSACAWPLAALLIALAGKPETQPFHFAFLQFPLLLAAAWGLQAAWHGGGFVRRTAALLLGLLSLAELGRTACRDYFFWRRADTGETALLAEQTLFRPEAVRLAQPGRAKSLALEGGGAAVFRNRIREVILPRADAWCRMETAPLPRLPWPLGSDWIFANGPIYPRDDRMFRAPAGPTVRRCVVWPTAPDTIRVGVRSGTWPCRVRLDFGGDRQILELPPNGQRVLTLQPRGRRAKPAAGCPAWLIPLTVNAELGDAWITILAGERDRRVYEAFGPGTNTLPATWSAAERTEVEQAAPDLFFLDSGEAPPLVLHAGRKEPLQLWPEKTVLEAGAYVLTFDVESWSEGPHLQVSVDAADAGEWREDTANSYPLQPGRHVVTHRWTKPFAPYECQARLRLDGSACRIVHWELRPDATFMLASLKSTAPVPWRAQPQPRVSPPRLTSVIGTRFGNGIRLEDMAFPPVVAPPRPLELVCRLRLNNYALRRPQEYAVFLHLRNADGDHIADFQFPLSQALRPGSIMLPTDRLTPPAGTYRVEMGVYNTRLQEQLHVRQPGNSASRVTGKTLDLGFLQIIR